MISEKIERASTALLSMQRHSWEQGIAMHAFLELGKMDIVCAMAFEAVNRSLEDGRAAVIGVTDGVTDHCSVGEGIKIAWEFSGSPYLKQGREKLLKWALFDAPRNSSGIIYHLNRTKEYWADSFYMCPPYFAAEGYPEEALKQWNGYWDVLYDSQAGLVSHKWDDETNTYSRKDHWGIGIGWTLASIPAMLRSLPKKGFEKDRMELIEKGTGLLEKLLGFLRPDGFFHEVVDDPNTFVETNLSQMTAYFIYSGVVQDWLKKEYLGFADRMRTSANKKMNEFGFIEGVCGAPTFDKPGYSPEGQAFYILMELAANRWEKMEGK